LKTPEGIVTWYENQNNGKIFITEEEWVEFTFSFVLYYSSKLEKWPERVDSEWPPVKFVGKNRLLETKSVTPIG